MPASAQRGTRGRPARLSREQIVEAAMELIDSEGLEAMSMRRLADELEVGTMTLYGYFRGKEELLDALVDLSSARSRRLRELGAGDWRRQLRELALAVRETMAEHRWEVELRFRRPLISPGAMRVPEAGMRILHEAGFEPAEAARLFRTVMLYIFGFTGFGDPVDVEEMRREAFAQIAPLPPDEYPMVTGALTDVVAVMAGEDQFEHGLELILDGIAARLS